MHVNRYGTASDAEREENRDPDRTGSPAGEGAVSRDSRRWDTPGESEHTPRLLAFLHSQTELLKLVSRQTPLHEILTKIAGLAERVFESALCSIELTDPECGRPVQRAAPSLPPEYLRALDRAENAGQRSVGAVCVGSDAPLYIPDFRGEEGERFGELSNLALSHGLRACWAHPVSNHEDQPVGAIALFFREPTAALAEDRQILSALAGITHFAVESDRRLVAKKAADQRFAALSASVPGVVYQRIVTPDGDIRYTYISEGAQDLFGVSPEEIVSNPKALFDTHGAQYRADFRERLLQASRDLTLWDVEATIIARDGTRKFTHAIARPHREADGTVVWNGIILEATRIKEAELAAAVAEAQTREAILESLSQGLALYDWEDKLVTCNSHYKALFPRLGDLIAPGIGYERIITAKIEDAGVRALSHEDPQQMLQHCLEAHRTGHFEAEWRLPDGRWVLVREHPTPDGGTVVLHMDISVLKNSESALVRAKEAAEVANRAKSEFLANMSHELRTPLNAIIGFSELMANQIMGPMGNDTYVEYAGDIQESGQHLLNVINDILDLSKIEAGKFTLHEECVDVGETIDRVVRMVSSRAEAGGLELVIEIDPDAPGLWADATALKQILLNLLSNAVKFTPEGGRVGISAIFGDDGDLCLTVSDTGIGIAEEDIAKVLSPFGQADSRLDRKYEGTGLGLPLAKSLTELHDGRLEILPGSGEGTVVVVRLPRRRVIRQISAA